jgi:hypothetical protein
MDKRGNQNSHQNNNQKQKSDKLEDKLVENLVMLQKVNTDLAEKFDKLTVQISSLLALFETTARSFASSPAVQASEKDKEFLDKINRLLDQNKTIAKGLTLMEERIRERVYGQSVPEPVRQNSKSEIEMTEQTEIHPEDQFKPALTGKPLPKF